MCVLLMAFTAACGGGGDGTSGTLYPDRANQYREDQERRVGGSVRIGGYTTTVTDVQRDGDTVRVSVRIENRDEEAQRIDATQWTLVNPRIQTLEASSADFPLTDLPGGKTVDAEVSFTIEPEETGDYYIQYKPEILDAARGIWRYRLAAAPGTTTVPAR